VLPRKDGESVKGPPGPAAPPRPPARGAPPSAGRRRPHSRRAPGAPRALSARFCPRDLFSPYTPPPARPPLQPSARRAAAPPAAPSAPAGGAPPQPPFNLWPLPQARHQSARSPTCASQRRGGALPFVARSPSPPLRLSGRSPGHPQRRPSPGRASWAGARSAALPPVPFASSLAPPRLAHHNTRAGHPCTHALTWTRTQHRNQPDGPEPCTPGRATNPPAAGARGGGGGARHSSPLQQPPAAAGARTCPAPHSLARTQPARPAPFFHSLPQASSPRARRARGHRAPPPPRCKQHCTGGPAGGPPQRLPPLSMARCVIFKTVLALLKTAPLLFLASPAPAPALDTSAGRPGSALYMVTQTQPL
jgi:hypothetical protein